MAPQSGGQPRVALKVPAIQGGLQYIRGRAEGPLEAACEDEAPRGVHGGPHVGLGLEQRVRGPLVPGVGGEVEREAVVEAVAAVVSAAAVEHLLACN